MTVYGGATLGGTGTIARVVNVQSNGTLMAGSVGAVGTLTVGANVTLGEGAVVQCSIFGGSVGLIRVNGTLTVPTNAVVNLGSAVSSPITLLSATSVAGATNGVLLSGWTVQPGLPPYRCSIRGNSIILTPFNGSVYTFR